jgi:toxin ParE1/3/4
MPELIIPEIVEQDLLEIWLYIAEDSPVNADRFLDKLNEMAKKLSEFPQMGTERPELADNLKGFPVGRYVIYYRCLANGCGIELVRVLSSYREADLLF